MNTPAADEDELEHFLEEMYRSREEYGALSDADRRRVHEQRRRDQFTSGHKVFTRDPNDPTRLILLFDPAVDVEPRDIPRVARP